MVGDTESKPGKIYQQLHTVNFKIKKAEFLRSFIWDKLETLDGRIILRWIFRKWEAVETGWSWLRIGTSGGHL
jgi:hypothetical protein